MSVPHAFELVLSPDGRDFELWDGDEYVAGYMDGLQVLELARGLLDGIVRSGRIIHVGQLAVVSGVLDQVLDELRARLTNRSG